MESRSEELEAKGLPYSSSLRIASEDLGQQNPCTNVEQIAQHGCLRNPVISSWKGPFIRPRYVWGWGGSLRCASALMAGNRLCSDAKTALEHGELSYSFTTSHFAPS